MSKPSWGSSVPESFDPAAMLAELKADPNLAEDAASHMSQDIDVIESNAEQENSEKAQQKPKKAEKEWPLRAIPITHLEEQPEPPRWLLKRAPSSEARESTWQGFCRMGKVGVIAAPGGTGKTMAAIGLGLAVATGKSWLRPGAWKGQPTPPDGLRVCSPGRVAVLLGEEDDDDIRRRAYYASKMMGLDSGDRQMASERLFLAGLAGQEVSLVDAEGGFDPKLGMLQEVLKAKAGEGWSLILVDPLARFAGIGAETDNALATRFVQALEQLTTLPGNPAVLFVHHERKSGGEGASAIRGSSALVDGARWALRLVPLMDPFDQRKRWKTSNGDRAMVLELVKSNYTPPIVEEIVVVQDSGYRGAVRQASKAEVAKLHSQRAEAKNAKKSKNSKAAPKDPPDVF
jgi:RecA-family ATPase